MLICVKLCLLFPPSSWLCLHYLSLVFPSATTSLRCPHSGPVMSRKCLPLGREKGGRWVHLWKVPNAPRSRLTLLAEEEDKGLHTVTFSSGQSSSSEREERASCSRPVYHRPGFLSAPGSGAAALSCRFISDSQNKVWGEPRAANTSREERDAEHRGARKHGSVWPFGSASDPGVPRMGRA